MRKLFVLLAVLACGDPTGPGEPLTGQWRGRVGDLQGVTLALVENSPSEITGFWTGAVGGTQRSGTASGSRDGDSFTLTFVVHAMPCGYGVTVEAERSGNSATGTAWGLDCAGGRTVWSSQVTMSK